MIGCTSPSAEQKKAEHIRELIDNELGIQLHSIVFGVKQK